MERTGNKDGALMPVKNPLSSPNLLLHNILGKMYYLSMARVKLNQ